MRTSALRCATFAAALVVLSVGPAYGLENPAKKTGESTRLEPLCRVQITPRIGLPAECLLLAFSEGVYLVRVVENDGEYKLQEDEIQAVKFFPLEERGRVRKPPRRDRDESAAARPDHATPPGGPFAALRERRHLWEEKLRALEPEFRALKRQGRLDEHMGTIETDLREARTAAAAGEAILALRVAHKVNGRVPDPTYWRRLVGTIADVSVRRSPEVWTAVGIGQARRGRRP
jgi:hypothetical protein